MPLIAAIRGRAEWRIHLDNVRRAWVRTFDDLLRLWRTARAMIERGVTLPEQGKFNAAEKLNFMMVMATWPLFGITGLLIWMPGVAFHSWMIHFGMALLAAPLMLGHIFMATINPGTRVGLSGMISGFVDRRWARHHYARWYRETFGDEPAPPRAEDLLLVSCPRCTAVRTIVSWNVLVEHVLDSTPLPCGACGTDMGRISIHTEPSLDDLRRLLDRLDHRLPRPGAGDHPPPAA